MATLEHVEVDVLHGTVPDAATRATASRVARSLPGVGAVRNLLGTRADPAVSAAGYGYPWLHRLLRSWSSWPMQAFAPLSTKACGPKFRASWRAASPDRQAGADHRTGGPGSHAIRRGANTWL
jgi:BON domain